MSNQTEKIAPGTWLIEENPGTGAAVYMYLLEGTHEALLIDTGYGSFPLKETVRELTDLPVTVILTHGHLDHIGGSAAFDRVLLHEGDGECYRLHAGKKERELFGIDPDRYVSWISKTGCFLPEMSAAGPMSFSA